MARKVKFDFVPSEYQEKFFDWVEHGVGNALIKARAGAAKTTTAVASMKLIPKTEKCLFIAFNKSIAEHLNEKLKSRPNCTARTTHSLGNLIVKRNLGSDIELDEYKYRNYVKSNITELTTTNGEIKTRQQVEEYIDNITKLIDYARFNLAQSEREINEIAQKYSIPVSFDECIVTQKCLEWGKTNTETIDYTDMIWLPVELSLKPIGMTYDWVYIDEAQDLSLCSTQLFLKCIKRGGRFVAIGDDLQCQPEGTKVLLSDGSEKNIENLKIGDKVVTYSGKSTCVFQGYKPKYPQYAKTIEKIEHHHVNEEIIKIITNNGLTTQYTYNHKCYAKFNRKNCEGKTILYLMCNEKNMYRIGTTQVFKKNGHTFGLSNRMIAENCNKGWILNVYDNEEEARLAETYYSTLYQIPQIIFKKRRACSNKIFCDKDVEELYEKLSVDYNMTEKASELLKHFHRSIDFPFHTNEHNNKQEKRHGRNYVSDYYACNLLPEVMDVIYFDPNNISLRTHGKRGCSYNVYKSSHTFIKEIIYEKRDCEVYSLSVKDNHNYIADGILTHNCINIFAGANEDAFNFMKNYPNTTLFELPISYRCAKNIIKFANNFVADIFARENAPDGIVAENCHIRDIKEGDMVLCRSKAPLINLYIKLLRKNMNCYIKGQDIGANLIKELEKVDAENLNVDLENDGVFVRLYDKLFMERNKLMQTRGLDYEDATLSSFIMEKYDEINVLLILAEKYKTKKELIKHINEIFKEDSQGVCLSTIHKAKGLEAENVYILCNSSMPSKLAVHDWEKLQEENLMYVAYTRPKNVLGFISEKEIRPIGSLQDPTQIINELIYIEHRVCAILGKEPMEKLENTDLLRFKLQNIKQIEDLHKDDNVVHIEENNTTTENVDLISELENLIS